MPNKDYYSILGVSKTASQDEIKSAYRKLAKQYHPDLHPNDAECAQKFKDINEAYEILGDSTKRSNYDQFGNANGNDFFGNSGGFSSGGFSGFGGFEDIFSNIFSGFGGASRTQEVSQGEDIVTHLDLSFEEAVFGCEKTIKVSRAEKCSSCSGTGAKNGTHMETCSDCKGTGQVRFVQDTMFGRVVKTGVCKKCNGKGKIIKEKCSDCNGKGIVNIQKEIKIKIPAGIDNNQVITMRNNGHASFNGGPNGDLQIEVSVRPHEILQRDGANLYLDLYVPFTTAYLGGKVTIPTTNGTQELTIPALTQPNTVFRLKGKGIKHLNREAYGDIIVTLRVEMPKSASKQDKEVIQKLQEVSSIANFAKSKAYEDKIKKYSNKKD